MESKCDDDHIPSLYDWFRMQGGYIHPYLSITETSVGRGLVATNYLHEGELLLHTPSHLWLGDTAAKHVLNQTLPAHHVAYLEKLQRWDLISGCEPSQWNLAVLIALINQKQVKHSALNFWAPLINAFPLTCVGAVCSDAESTKPDATERERHIRGCLGMARKEGTILQLRLGIPNIIWALSMTITRMQIRAVSEAPMLAPFLDMINHHSLDSCCFSRSTNVEVPREPGLSDATVTLASTISLSASTLDSLDSYSGQMLYYYAKRDFRASEQLFEVYGGGLLSHGELTAIFGAEMFELESDSE